MGANSQTPLIEATDENLYGTTPTTIFKITLHGKLETLYTFSPNTCQYPNGLVQATDGNLYGTITSCVENTGTVFQLSLGLAPLLKRSPPPLQ